MSKYAAIISRLEAATGPNYEIECSIHEMCGEQRPIIPSPYTASLEAAIALVERMLPGWRKSVGENLHHGYWQGRVYRFQDDDIFERYGHHDTAPAIALLLAMFRALEAQEVQS